MEIWKAVVVGIVQGLAEFLPISSSGHIVLSQFLLGMNEVGQPPKENIAFEVVLHIGTLLSVLLFFRARLWSLTRSLFTKELKAERMMILWLALASIPAIIAYLLFKEQFKAAYNNPVLVSALLIVTGFILFLPNWIKKRKVGEKEVGWREALVMGCTQAFAILPGISRSGSTIVGGLSMGAKPEKVAEFSFLMSLPAIGGGFLFALKDIMEVNGGDLGAAMGECFQPAYVAGALAAAVVGILAIYLVMDAVKKGKLVYFSYYCFAAGLAGIIYFSLGHGALWFV